MRATPVRLVVVTAAIGVLTACGGGSGGGSAPTAAQAPAASSSAPAAPQRAIAGMSAEDITRKALDRVTTASSVRVRGWTSEGGKKLDFDVTTAAGKGCVATMSKGGEGAFQLRTVGTTTWMKPDRTFWTSQGPKDAATLSAVAGKWVTLSSAADLNEICDVRSILGEDLTGTSLPKLTKGVVSTVAGRPAIEIKGDQGSLFVSMSGTPELLRMTGTADGGTQDFSDYGAEVALTPPSADETVDGKKYGL